MLGPQAHAAAVHHQFLDIHGGPSRWQDDVRQPLALVIHELVDNAVLHASAR
jgi:two-component sensor histidine kinase